MIWLHRKIIKELVWVSATHRILRLCATWTWNQMWYCVHSRVFGTTPIQIFHWLVCEARYVMPTKTTKHKSNENEWINERKRNRQKKYPHDSNEVDGGIVFSSIFFVCFDCAAAASASSKSSGKMKRRFFLCWWSLVPCTPSPMTTSTCGEYSIFFSVSFFDFSHFCGIIDRCRLPFLFLVCFCFRFFKTLSIFVSVSTRHSHHYLSCQYDGRGRGGYLTPSHLGTTKMKCFFHRFLSVRSPPFNKSPKYIPGNKRVRSTSYTRYSTIVSVQEVKEAKGKLVRSHYRLT